MSLIHRIETADQGKLENVIKHFRFCVSGVLHPIIGSMMTKMMAHHIQLRQELWISVVSSPRYQFAQKSLIITHIASYNINQIWALIDIVMIVACYNMRELLQDLLTLTTP